MGGLKDSRGWPPAFMMIRHAILPAVAIGLTAALALPPEQRTIVVLFASLPTASSAYVLASRMGGDGAFVAGLGDAVHAAGMLSVPLWLALAALHEQAQQARTSAARHTCHSQPATSCVAPCASDGDAQRRRRAQARVDRVATGTTSNKVASHSTGLVRSTHW